MIEWFAAPLSGAREHLLADWAVWHARWMVLGWGVLLPLGALVARYGKIAPGQRWPERLDHPFWWHAHRALQWAGVIAMTVGLGLVLAGRPAATGGATVAARWHAAAGWALVAIGWLQVAGGLARGSKGGPTEPSLRGDHYDMTPRRRWFERLHKAFGWLAVLASIAVIALGLAIADAPRWMAVVLGAWWLVLAALAVHAQRRGRCIDTYQAIWGPDPAHPGNRRRPIGWGVRRPTAGPGPTT